MNNRKLIIAIIAVLASLLAFSLTAIAEETPLLYPGGYQQETDPPVVPEETYPPETDPPVQIDTTPDPGYVDPGYVEPTYADPGYVDPGYVDPDYVDPGYVDPGYVEPDYVDPGYQTPVYDEPNTDAQWDNGEYYSSGDDYQSGAGSYDHFYDEDYSDDYWPTLDDDGYVPGEDATNSLHDSSGIINKHELSAEEWKLALDLDTFSDNGNADFDFIKVNDSAANSNVSVWILYVGMALVAVALAGMIMSIVLMMRKLKAEGGLYYGGSTGGKYYSPGDLSQNAESHTAFSKLAVEDKYYVDDDPATLQDVDTFSVSFLEEPSSPSNNQRPAGTNTPYSSLSAGRPKQQGGYIYRSQKKNASPARYTKKKKKNSDIDIDF